MSIVTFNRRFTASVKLTAELRIVQYPYFEYNGKMYSGASGSGSVEYTSQESNLTIAEETCGYYGGRLDAVFTRTAFSSGVTESGYQNIGVPNYKERNFRANNPTIDYGDWIVNTSPVIKVEITRDQDGNVTDNKLIIDGDEVTQARFYTIRHPTGLKDQPMYVSSDLPYISGKPLYDGDILQLNFTGGTMGVIRQKRYQIGRAHV